MTDNPFSFWKSQYDPKCNCANCKQYKEKLIKKGKDSSMGCTGDDYTCKCSDCREWRLGRIEELEEEVSESQDEIKSYAAEQERLEDELDRLRAADRQQRQPIAARGPFNPPPLDFSGIRVGAVRRQDRDTGLRKIGSNPS